MQQHHQLDQFTTQWLDHYRETGKHIFCQSGCSACCNLAVHATFPEAVIVARQLNSAQTDQLGAYIKRLQKLLPGLKNLQDYLKQHRKHVGPCPFLTAAGVCSIYPVRPLSCRALLSTRPSEWCAVDFSELDHWDKISFESGLDREAVAWPTHYVAATQDYAAQLEQELTGQMKDRKGWSLTGNFATLVWLEARFQVDEFNLDSSIVKDILSENRLDNGIITHFK